MPPDTPEVDEVNELYRESRVSHIFVCGCLSSDVKTENDSEIT